MKKLLVFCTCAIFLQVFAINEEQAGFVTQNFLREKKISRDHHLSQFSLKEVIKKKETEIFYIMSLGNDEGFIIVSATQYLPPIFGYSFENSFSMHPSIEYYLNIYSDFVLQEKELQRMPNEHYTKEWNHYLTSDFTPKRLLGNGVPPLITSHWNQNRYYNTHCPWDDRAGAAFDYRVPNGCVALAGAQLMNYYRHPEAGKYTYSYTPYGYPRQTIYPAQQRYNWDAMCDRAINYTNEIAKLAHHLGVTVKMGYAPGGSGAHTETLVDVLNKNFNYTAAEKASRYESDKFIEELDANHPILMDGCSDQGCHAFLVDGYDNSEKPKFHFNWGWGGEADAYFILEEQYFHNSGYAYLKIKPMYNYPVQCQQFKRQTSSKGYITNGSTSQPYESAPDCSWIVAAPGATQYTFTFSRLDTQEGIDLITIYKGSTETSGIAAVFSGTKTPSTNVSVQADSVLITFTTTDPNSLNDTHRGFLMNYTTNKPQQKCDAVTTLKNPSGYITDGTLPEENYTPWTSCTWNLAPEYSTGFFGLFHEFNLALGDFVDFYDATKNPPRLLVRFDRNELPNIGEVFSLPSPKIQIKFVTDNYDHGKGFKFQYFSMLGVNDNSLLDNLFIFPNPVSDVINLSFSSELINQPVNCCIVDVSGKEVYSSIIDYQGDVNFTQIPVAHLSNGIYFLKLTTSAGKVVSKIIKN